jgi:small redox-active disulfide protein 2
MSTTEITQISIAGLKVGIMGWQPALAAAQAMAGASEDEIAQFLFDTLKMKNYIPSAAAAEYRQAFLREYKKARGEPVAEERRGLSIRVLGPGCAACRQLEQNIMAVVAELGLPADIEHVTDLKEIARLGVVTTPALLINDELKAAGQAPKKEKLKKLLQEAMAAL